MTKKKGRRRSLADPVELAPLDGKGTIQVVIETPKESRNKYSFDPELRIVSLKKVLPAGMAFPYDFGFVSSHVRQVNELGKKFCKELEEVFVNYHELDGKKYRILDMKGPVEARRRVEDGMRKKRGKN